MSAGTRGLRRASSEVGFARCAHPHPLPSTLFPRAFAPSPVTLSHTRLPASAAVSSLTGSRQPALTTNPTLRFPTPLVGPCPWVVCRGQLRLHPPTPRRELASRSSPAFPRAPTQLPAQGAPLSPSFSRATAPGAPSQQRRESTRAAASASASDSCMGGSGDGKRHENRLAKEQSPYLLQHAHNPVDWYPWGEDAFAKARAENKLIFLSVGYSTCHWCHVMERESFESEAVAALMNQDFVNVKVDREERPDVDKVYMTYVQATQGGGGWPMSVFLTPSLHPVLGGTYFPPEDKYGRIGFKSLLKRVAQVWKEKPREMEESGKDVMRQLLEASEGPASAPGASSAGPSEFPPSLVAGAILKCCSQLGARFDKRLGGFGSAPKFPRPSELNLMLRRYHWGCQFPDEGGPGQGLQEGKEALERTLFTLQSMARGGMHDHVGGGFHRYSVDDFWHVSSIDVLLCNVSTLASAILMGPAAHSDRDSDTESESDAYFRSGTHSASGSVYSDTSTISDTNASSGTDSETGSDTGTSRGGDAGEGPALEGRGRQGSSIHGDSSGDRNHRTESEHSSSSCPDPGGPGDPFSGLSLQDLRLCALGVPVVYLPHGAVPHFEKMLYDQAQLAASYLDAFALTGDRALALVARDVLDYVGRDLTHPEGGFFSAEDADSLEGAEKKEGAFYVWTKDEIEEALGKGSDRARLFELHYYVKPAGNCDLSPRSDPQQEFVGKNCLIERQSVAVSARALGMGEEEAERVLGECREILHQRRSQRPRPHLDDKVIVSWNGLMISAFARASRILQAEASSGQQYFFPVTGCKPSAYLEAAVRAAEFIQAKLYDPTTRRLRRSFRQTASEAQGFADDYAFLVTALLDLFEASGGDTRWLTWALDLQDTQDALFWDKTAGGYFSTVVGDASILLRLKEDYDGAEPSANSYSLANLARLSHYVGGERSQDLLSRAHKTALAFQERLSSVPLALPQLCAFLPLLGGGGATEPRQVILAGTRGEGAFEGLLTAALSSPSPDKIVIPVDRKDAAAHEFWERHNPAVLQVAGIKRAAQAEGGEQAAAFVCQNFTCLAPTSDPAVLKRVLGQPLGAPKVTVTEMKL